MGDIHELPAKKSKNDDAKEVLEFLNKKTGRHYRPVAANLELILARFKEGYEISDLKAVIAIKCREWSNDDVMDKFLRPKTLFNRTNMANYSGEIGDE